MRRTTADGLTTAMAVGAISTTGDTWATSTPGIVKVTRFQPLKSVKLLHEAGTVSPGLFSVLKMCRVTR
jgi:hypothetical protein